MNEKIVARYRELERDLELKYPDCVRGAKRLADGGITDPATAKMDGVWKCLWPKPLYSNARVETGKRNILLLTPYVADINAWGGGTKTIRFHRVGKGIKTKSFKMATEGAIKVRQDTKVALHRLFAIQGAAVALMKRAETAKTPCASFIGVPIRELVVSLQNELGFGWGYTTVLHFLTDLGLACKPDIHVFNSVQYLKGTPAAKRKRNPNFDEAIKVNEFVMELVASLYGSVTPKRLRYTDKILMEISRQGIVKLPRKTAKLKWHSHCVSK